MSSLEQGGTGGVAAFACEDVERAVAHSDQVEFAFAEPPRFDDVSGYRVLLCANGLSGGVSTERVPSSLRQKESRETEAKAATG